MRAFVSFVLVFAALTSLVPGQVSPAGPEFLVNTRLRNDQFAPVVAMNSSGASLVLWQLIEGEEHGSDESVSGQLFGTSGERRGGEFQATTHTCGLQESPQAAIDDAGNSLVAFYEGSRVPRGLYGRRIGPSGERLGPAIRLRKSKQGDFAPLAVIAMNGSGDHVMVWPRWFTTNSNILTILVGQRFDALGSPIGGEFIVSNIPSSEWVRPSVAMDGSGGFVAAWERYLYSGNFDVWVQRMDPSNAAAGGLITANTTTAGVQREPSVAVNPAGRFTVVWSSTGQDGSGEGVFGQTFDDLGARIGGEFQVNTATAGDQLHPSIAMDASGNFVVAWESRPAPGSGTAGAGIFARWFDAAGAPLGPEVQINTSIYASQALPKVASDAAGNLLVVWQSQGQDGDGLSIIARRFCALGDVDADGDGTCDAVDNCVGSNPGQSDADGDRVGDECDNCPGLYNPAQEDWDHDLTGDLCEIVITSPPDGGTYDCSTGVTPPTITWAPGAYDRFKVYFAGESSFASAVSSGDSWLGSTAYIVPAKKWKRACGLAIGGLLYIEVCGIDNGVPKGDPRRRACSDFVELTSAAPAAMRIQCSGPS